MYLTKSDYVLGLSCPTKLSFKALGRYPIDDEGGLNEAFIEQGYQVQGLARSRYPEGILINTLNMEAALELTEQYLQMENVTLFEAAFLIDGCYFRVDILQKKESIIRMVEVKSKGEDLSSFYPYRRNGFLKKKYWEYFNDLSFQYYNLRKLYGEKVLPYLMLIDKNAVITVDDLHLAFIPSENKLDVISTTEELGDPIQVEIDVQEYLDRLLEETGENIERLKEVIGSKEVVYSPVTQKCNRCEHRATGGFKECISTQLGWKDSDFARNSIFDVWYMTKVNKLVDQGKYFFEDIEPEDLYNKKGLLGTTGRRQWLQITQTRDNLGEFVNEALFEEMDRWEYPLHFIDFETSTPPIPSIKGLHPFAMIAFQYSVHSYHEDGRITHKDWIDTTSKFPNFDFVRNLKNDLGERGTIFCYSDHENTVLTAIREQIETLGASDAEELIQWIDTVTWKNGSPREMVDMFKLVKEYYYHPLMGRSNSIKKVLPAVIHESDFLKKKYSKGYNSSNFKDARFLAKSDNPYDLLKEEEGIAKGDEALVAYLKIRQGNEDNVKEVERVLLKYCELDTLAMVMIFEHWNDLKSRWRN